MVTVLVIVGRSEVRAIVWTPAAAMLKSIVSPPAPAFTLLIAPRREQSPAAPVQAVRLPSPVVSTVNVLAADAGAAARASVAKVAPSAARIARPPPKKNLMDDRPSHPPERESSANAPLGGEGRFRGGAPGRKSVGRRAPKLPG